MNEEPWLRFAFISDEAEGLDASYWLKRAHEVGTTLSGPPTPEFLSRRRLRFLQVVVFSPATKRWKPRDRPKRYGDTLQVGVRAPLGAFTGPAALHRYLEQVGRETLTRFTAAG